MKYVHLISAGFALAIAIGSFATTIAAPDPAAPDDYATVAAGRAAKIVGALELTDEAQRARVERIVADQYVRLNAIHAARDARLTEVDKSAGDREAAKRLARDEAAARLYDLHAEYLARLAVELSPTQIDHVKDGMTYGVLPNTWRNYQAMLPEMTAGQKRQVLAWLIEAREHAMDGSTSEEKHGWFGKYKGRITNYLTAQGYDLKKAEKAWLERTKK